VVGTHIGAIAVPLARDCRELVAIEANPNTFKLLEANVRLNALNNVTLHNVGASDKEETLSFLLNRDASGGSKRMPATQRFFYTYDQPEVINIPAVSLDDLLGERTFDLIFMDIEGSEYFALKGMRKILARSRALMVEFLPHHIADVANVGIDEFLSVIEPHFPWLFIPGKPEMITGAAISQTLRGMFEAGVGHDGIYFLKEPEQHWLATWGILPPA
jgi:FkbM family methyltransferase